jgi:hypothetical protein
MNQVMIATKNLRTWGRIAAPGLISIQFAWVYSQAASRINPPGEQQEATKAPMGQFANMRSYPDASFKDVTAPNADTLYSSAWLDLSQEPYVLHVPDERGRYDEVHAIPDRHSVTPLSAFRQPYTPLRARAICSGRPANLPQDAIYPTTVARAF